MQHPDKLSPVAAELPAARTERWITMGQTYVTPRERKKLELRPVSGPTIVQRVADRIVCHLISELHVVIANPPVVALAFSSLLPQQVAWQIGALSQFSTRDKWGSANVQIVMLHDVAYDDEPLDKITAELGIAHGARHIVIVGELADVTPRTVACARAMIERSHGGPEHSETRYDELCTLDAERWPTIEVAPNEIKQYERSRDRT